VLTNCRSHSGTLNSECEANISCDLDRSYPAPHPGPGGGLPGPGPGGRLPGPGPGGRLPGPAPLPEIGSQLIGQWKASNCSHCFLQVSEYGGQLYGDMNPWDLNRSASNGAQPIVILSRDLLEYRGDTFRIERDRYSSRLRIVNTNTWSRNNVQSAELSSYAPAPIPQPIPAPVPPRR